MATVYRARDETLARDVAVKVLRPGYAADPSFVERFRREARHVASLQHPNIVTIGGAPDQMSGPGASEPAVARASTGATPTQLPSPTPQPTPEPTPPPTDHPRQARPDPRLTRPRR